MGGHQAVAHLIEVAVAGGMIDLLALENGILQEGEEVDDLESGCGRGAGEPPGEPLFIIYRAGEFIGKGDSLAFQAIIIN